MNAEVYLIGGNHHNMLGVARSLGIEKIKSNCLVVTDLKKSFISKSKFVKSCKVFKTEKEAFDYLLKVDIFDNVKHVVIPCSDGAALELDSRLDEFKDKFVVPSLNLSQGMIEKYMSKIEQYNFAVNNGIKIAKAQLIDISKFDINSFTLNYPCILKPNVSAKGDKKDIVICYDKDKLIYEISVLKDKGYEEIFAQEFIKIDYEIDVFGCVCKNYPYLTITPTKTIRSWPAKTGTNSFSQIIIDKEVIEKCQKIVKCLNQIGFYGLYDIELFVLPLTNEIYLNEINFRNSGDVYMGLNQKFNYPYIWVRDVLGESNEGVLNHPVKDEYCMTELSDFRNVLKKHIKYKTWKKDYKRSSDFALKFKGDMRPRNYRIYQYVCMYIKKCLPKFHKKNKGVMK